MDAKRLWLTMFGAEVLYVTSLFLILAGLWMVFPLALGVPLAIATLYVISRFSGSRHPLSRALAALAAGIKFTKPVAGTTLKAGTAIEVDWQDGGDGPKIADLTTYQLILVGGGQKDAEQQVIKVLTTAGNFALGGNTASGLVEVGLPGADKPANA